METNPLPNPVTSTEQYLARIVQQNDEILQRLTPPEPPVSEEVVLKEPKPARRKK